MRAALVSGDTRAKALRKLATAVIGLVLAAGVGCAWAAGAVIGFVAPDEEPRYADLLRGLRQGLQGAGAAGQGVTIIEHRIERGDAARAGAAARALSAGGAQVAFVVGTELSRAVRAAARELPIVFITPGDPVRAGLAASLARPGNHLTGMTFEFAELSAKRLELLKELAPTAQRIGVVHDPRDASPRQGLAAAREAAARLHVQLVDIEVDALKRSGHVAARKGAIDALVVIPGGAIAAVTKAALEFAAMHRIASVVAARSDATQSATLSYGVSDVAVARSAARLVARILEGHPAGELPIEQPTRFELIVNQRSARALGITVPASVLLRADAVIE